MGRIPVSVPCYDIFGPEHLSCYDLIFAPKGLDPFIPEFLKWALPSLNLALFTDANRVLD